MRLRMLLALSAALCVLAVPDSRVAACSCAGGTLEEQIAAADLAVTATATEWSTLDGAPLAGFELDQAQLLYTFAIDGVIKGNVTGPQVKVVAQGGLGGGCGIRFDVGRRMLVLAFANGRGFKTSLCTGSRELAADDVLPVPVAQPPPAAGPEISGGIVALGGIALVLAVASYLAFRRGGADKGSG